MRLSRLAPVLIAGGLAACATSSQEIAHGDPLEGVNRATHGFNQALSEHVVAPIADAAKSNSSESGRSGAGEALHHVGNMLNNLGEPKNAINGALQANPGTVGTAVGRFTLNSTVGLLGVFDVASAVGLHERKEDFGQTLGSWGAPTGPYMVAPVAGPSNARDVTGMVVDTMLNPASIIPIPGEAVTAARVGVTAADAADKAEETTATATAEADPYAATRDRYDQRRQALIDNERVSLTDAAAPVEHRRDAPAAGPTLRGVDGYGPADLRTLAPGEGLVIDITPLPDRN